MATFKILGHEYNEYVIGFIIKTSKGDINAQFEQCHSNHPEPAYELQLACEGDDTHRKFTETEIDELCNYMASQEDLQKIESLFTMAMYNSPDFARKTAPIYEWEIEEAAEFVEE